jgi:hypothetical protein
MHANAPTGRIRIETANHGLLVAACVTLVLFIGVSIPVAAEVYDRLVLAMEVAEPPISAWVAGAYPFAMVLAVLGAAVLVVKERWVEPAAAAVINALCLALTLLVGMAMLAAVTLPLLSMADSLLA